MLLMNCGGGDGGSTSEWRTTDRDARSSGRTEAGVLEFAIVLRVVGEWARFGEGGEGRSGTGGSIRECRVTLAGTASTRACGGSGGGGLRLDCLPLASISSSVPPTTDRLRPPTLGEVLLWLLGTLLAGRNASAGGSGKGPWR